ncbi:MAG: class 1 fructose-bisphosphatase [Devosiaceae bacterium]|nr:class 1 fructose-bisphosphatase [Devosiaceae bacterium]
MQKQTLKNWIEGQGASEGVSDILLAIASSCIKIAEIVKNAPLDGLIGASSQTNVQGEVQKDLDIITNDLMVADLLKVPFVSAMVSEEIDEIIQNPNKNENANLAVCFDPLDGSSNIDNNGIIGTIFSVLELASNSKNITQSDVLSASKNQKAAGYFIYGPACLLMVSVGNKVSMFSLSEKQQQFLLVDGDISIAKNSNEFAINMSYQRFWDSAIAKYIAQCLLGEQGKRKKNFNMRWAGSMVADVHRIFMHGGVFIYPAMDKKGSENGKLRFLYEANPMAMLVENAGGMAISNPLPIREISATNIHQRVPVVLGSSDEVEILLKLYQNIK